jgi:hypothetical protein
MIRALTIRFVIMCAGVVLLVILANVLSPPPALILGTYIIYMVGSALIIGNYCIDHEDEIPTRSQGRQHRHR